MNTPRSATTQWRKRQAELGFVRVEVQVRKEDAPLVREVAQALADPARHDAACVALKEHVAPASRPSFKSLISAAPLESIELERQQDFGRDIDL